MRSTRRSSCTRTLSWVIMSEPPRRVYVDTHHPRRFMVSGQLLGPSLFMTRPQLTQPQGWLLPHLAQTRTTSASSALPVHCFSLDHIGFTVPTRTGPYSAGVRADVGLVRTKAPKVPIEAAGAAPGLVVHHFGSKEGLRRALDWL